MRSVLVVRLLLAASITAVAGGWQAAEQPATVAPTIPWQLPRLLEGAPPHTWMTSDGPVRALTYGGEPYRGQPTRVFAYFASPATRAASSDTAGAASARVPGIVLVHGGGGRAFADWAEIWARRGYAAIAMDLAGCGPDGQRLPDGGPDQGDETKFRAIDGPVEDQWPFHAVANVILAHSLLRSFPEVDPDRTAITGISWGGYLTCIVAGLDSRFRVAMPVYGCGFLRENSAWVTPQFDQMTPAQSARWVGLWDPSRYIGAATMPIVFLNGTNDFAYPLDSYAKTCRLVRSDKHFSIQLQMPHGHIFDFPECFLFIDQYLQAGTPLPVITRPVVAGGRVSALVDGPEPIVAARLHFTIGPHVENPTRPWTTQPLEVHGNRVEGPAPPEDATAWYVDVTDQRKAVVSSEPMVPGVNY
jgi:dienelactone hydrolase